MYGPSWVKPRESDIEGNHDLTFAGLQGRGDQNEETQEP